MRVKTSRTLAIFSSLPFFLLLWVSSMDAGSLAVVDSAARIGAFGLKVTVSSTCSGPSDLVLANGSLSGPATYEGCRTISSSTTEIAGPGTVIFRSGQRISLSNGFVVRSDATFVAEINSSLLPDAFLEDRTPEHEQHYSAGFFVRLDQLTIGGSDKLNLFTAYASNARPWLWLTAKRNVALNETRLVIQARRNDDSVATTENITEAIIPTGWVWVSLQWKAADLDVSNGYLQLSLDGVVYAELTDLPNSNGRIDTVRLGASEPGVDTFGSFDMDQFQSQKGEAIAPPM